VVTLNVGNCIVKAYGKETFQLIISYGKEHFQLIFAPQEPAQCAARPGGMVRRRAE
jgi:hypothetical protein